MRQKQFLGLLLVLTLHMPASANFSDIILFGDSLTDVGNLFALTSLAPPPVPGDPYFNGRFANGPNYADVYADRLGLGPLTPSVLGGTNYAAGGARSDYHLIPELSPAFSLVGQVEQFLVDVSGTVDPDAVYVFWGGNNDIQDAFFAPDPVAFVDMAAQNLFDAISDLAAAGAETIIVPNVPNVGATPRAVDAGISAQATALTLRLNGVLDALLLTISDADIIPFDTFGLLEEVVNDPAEFGFTNVTDACYSGPLTGGIPPVPCDNPEEYLFWDDFHPSAAAHNIIGHLIPEPAGCVLLAFGVAGLGVARRWNSRGECA